MTLVHLLITLYIYVLVAVMILSWIPVTSSDGALAQINRFLAKLTEPVLRPLRSIMPRPNVGGVYLDFSVLVAIIILAFINRII